MKKFSGAVSILLLSAALCGFSGQFTIPAVTGANARSSSGCAAPSTAYRWAASNTGNKCGTAMTACGAGNTSVEQATDLSGLNQLKQSSTTDQPVWTANALNSLPSFAFSGSPVALAASSPSVPAQNFTMYAVFQISSISSNSVQYLICPAGTAYHGLCMGINDHNGVIVLKLDSTAGTYLTGFIGSSSLGTGIWYTAVATLNYAGGSPYPVVFYLCSGGSCITDKSGTWPATLNSSDSTMGYSSYGSDNYFKGQIAEAGVMTSVDSNPTADIGAWSHCEYGI